jgi:multidrug efflux pump subunit AcrA (membrane-fusion protein)
VVYNVIIDVDNPQLKLRPGMTANVNFTVASADNVLKMPNAALRYRPPDTKPEEIQKLLSSFPNTVSADTHQTEGGKMSSEGLSGSKKSENQQGSQGRAENGATADSGKSVPGASGNGFFRARSGKLLGRQGGGAEAVVKPSTSERYGINADCIIPQSRSPEAKLDMIWVDSNGRPNRDA